MIASKRLNATIKSRILDKVRRAKLISEGNMKTMIKIYIKRKCYI
jgi:hypothetical protein